MTARKISLGTCSKRPYAITPALLTHTSMRPKRLAASVYFEDVTPAGGERVADSTSGANYYKFTITGKVVY